MSTTNDTPRLTPTQRLHEVTMAAMQRRPAEPEHAVTLSRNAKGAVQIEVTVRGYSLSDVLLDARETFTSLDASYPYDASGGAA